VVGIDRNGWALGEAASTYRAFGLAAKTKRAEAHHDTGGDAILAAFTVNELPDASRDALLLQFLDCRRRGGRVLVVEPIAGGVARWWSAWRREFEQAGGRADEWRVRTALPPIVAKLDRAAGLDHRELTARSLWLGRDAAV